MWEKDLFLVAIRPLTVVCWQQKLDAGRPDFIPRGSDPTEMIPIPAVGYWRKEGFTSFFVEVEPRTDGSQEIEIELKWSDDKGKVLICN